MTKRQYIAYKEAFMASLRTVKKMGSKGRPIFCDEEYNAIVHLAEQDDWIGVDELLLSHVEPLEMHNADKTNDFHIEAVTKLRLSTPDHIIYVQSNH